MRQKGQGCEADPAEALAWFEAAARQGLAVAARALADIYRNGRGVPADPDLAAWWQEAAEREKGDA
jgi:TPR repeat protein